MFELFTIGGGEYIVNVMNAVAAWTGGGGYKSLIRVVMVMGLIYTLLIVAFSLDWRAWMNWFLQSTLIYLCLMVPTVTIKVTDRVNPSLPSSVVANVPLGLGVIASFTSQIGDYLTRTAETVFVMPSQLQYSSNGIIYGSKLMEATRQIRITDPEFAANINEHMKRCVFYDVMLGFKSMDGLAKSTDLWTDIGPGSPARAQPFITRSGSTTTTAIVTCRDAYTALTPLWTDFINDFRPKWAKTLYPNLSNAVAEAKLVADLPVTYQAFTANASNAISIMRQNLAINSFMQARDDMAGGTGSAAIDSFAATRADLQTRNTYSAIAQGAMKWVPILNIVLTVVFYAMFPVIFPLFLMPRTGVGALKGYAMGFFYLAAWGPLYVVLHMILMGRGLSAGLAIANGGATLGSFAGIGAVNDETATLAGYMIATVPFLAAGMARGAMAIASHATSFLAPSQNAAEAAALEATTGNYAYGNASLANSTINTQSRDQWNTQPSFRSGAPVMTEMGVDGRVGTSFANGQSVFDSTGAISRGRESFTLSDGWFTNQEKSLSSVFEQSRTVRQSLSEESRLVDAMRQSNATTFTRSSGTESASGIERNNSVRFFNNEGQDVTDTVSRNFSDSSTRSLQGSREALFSTSAQLASTLSGGVGVPGLGGWKGSSTISGNSENRDGVRGQNDQSQRSEWSDGRAASDRQSAGSEASNTESGYGRSGSFSRTDTTSSNTVSFDQAQEHVRSRLQAVDEAERKAKSYSDQLSYMRSNRGEMSANVTEEFRQWLRAEEAANPSLPQTDLFAVTRTPSDAAHLSGMYARFLDQYGDKEIRDLQAQIDPSSVDLVNVSAPSVSVPDLGKSMRGRASGNGRGSPSGAGIGADFAPDPTRGRVERGSAAVDSAATDLNSGRNRVTRQRRGMPKSVDDMLQK